MGALAQSPHTSPDQYPENAQTCHFAGRAGRGGGNLRIRYDIFRTFESSFMLGGWYKQEERDL
jgi:hypothetical protein